MNVRIFSIAYYIFLYNVCITPCKRNLKTIVIFFPCCITVFSIIALYMLHKNFIVLYFNIFFTFFNSNYMTFIRTVCLMASELYMPNLGSPTQKEITSQTN